MKKFEEPELTVENLSLALYEANKKLKENEKKRLEFYSNISHDLRAPITALSNSIEYMLTAEDITPEEQKETLTIMQKRTEYMSRLINDIFLLSSLESSDKKVHKEPVDMDFFLEDYYYMNLADSRFEDADFTLDMPNPLSLTLDIDPMLMQRVLDNLLTNALKYSKGKPVIVLGAYIDQDSSPNKLIIYVKDNGIGIAKKHLPHIFDRSYTANKSRTPNSSNGSGFGLSIVKSIVEHHDGLITCESEQGVGSRFEIQLNLPSC
jgi:signal transduction histidine kinase